jgi:CRISPR-associated protein Csd2
MWDCDRSASCGLMAPRGLYIFSHESKPGNAPAHKLFERIHAELKDPGMPPRQFGDYNVTIHDADLPQGIILTRLIEG